MEIGSKLKEARLKTELTQEEVAEKIGVSRQTISNWENNKSYPDIISVIHLSDLYSISLDELLKGDVKMMEHLDKTTNEVKSRQTLSKLIQVSTYVILWASCLIWFWVGQGNDGGFAMAFSLLTFYLILPIATFVVSIFIGKDDSWGKYRWLLVFFFGMMFSLEVFGTFSMANTITFGNYNYPTISDAIPGIILSALGMGVGVLIKKRKRKVNLLQEEKRYSNEVMKNADRKSRLDILEKYNEKECSVELLESLAELDDKTIQLILKEVNNTTLIYALAGASGKVCKKIMANVSGRMLYFLNEKLESDEFDVEKITEAQNAIIQIASTIQEKTVSC